MMHTLLDRPGRRHDSCIQHPYGKDLNGHGHGHGDPRMSICNDTPNAGFDSAAEPGLWMCATEASHGDVIADEDVVVI